MFKVGTLVSPIEGLKLLVAVSGILETTVGTLVSPIEGLKPGLEGDTGTQILESERL